MTHHSDEPTIGLDDATAHFVTLETYHQLDTSLAAHQCLSKPFSQEDLHQFVENLMARSV